jgi:predicted GIY-YIG superfamily endonuclease
MGRKTIVYQCYFSNNYKRYIGITYCLEQRIKDHYTASSLFGRALRRHIGNEKWTILAICQTAYGYTFRWAD